MILANALQSRFHSSIRKNGRPHSTVVMKAYVSPKQSLKQFTAVESLISGMILSVLLFGVILVKPSSATTRRSTDRVSVSESSRIDDDMLVAAGMFEVDGFVNGDVFAVARDFRLRGTIDGVVLVASEHSNIDGDISNSLAIFSRQAYVGATVRGSAYMFVQKIEIGEEALFSRDVTLFCDSLFMGGTINGKLNCTVGSQVKISGTVDGDLEITSDASIRILETARIGGDLIIHGETSPLDIEDGAVISGEIVRLEGEKSDSNTFSFDDVILLIYLVFAFFVLALITLFLSRSHFQRATTAVKKESLRSFAFGIVALVVGFFVSMALVITLIGIFSAAVLFSVIIVVTFLFGPIYAASGIGALVISSRTRDDLGISLARVFVGLVILFAISAIPYAGGALFFLAGVIGMGAFIIAARPAPKTGNKELQPSSLSAEGTP